MANGTWQRDEQRYAGEHRLRERKFSFAEALRVRKDALVRRFEAFVISRAESI